MFVQCKLHYWKTHWDLGSRKSTQKYIFMSTHNTFPVVWKLFWISSTLVLPEKFSGNTTDRENNFSWSLDHDQNKCVSSMGILIRPFNWLKAFQLSFFNLFITRLAFSSPNKKNISTWKLKTLLINWKVSSVTPRDEKYHL